MQTVDLILPSDLSNRQEVAELPLTLRLCVEEVQRSLSVINKNSLSINICDADGGRTSNNPVKVVYFSSPEQLLSFESNACPQADVYSIGLVDFRLNPIFAKYAIYFDDLIALEHKSNANATRLLKVLKSHIDKNKVSVGEDILKTFFKMSFVGKSESYTKIVENVYRYAKCQAPVLIEAETGTGKESLARAIHYFSDYSKNGFIPINCAAIPDSLFESELFGHEKGAFTHAQHKHSGLIELAENGTLFLDEVDALSPKAQSGLLRFLQTGEVRSVGGTQIRRIPTRVVAATNANLLDCVEKGLFRSDLHFRLNVLSLDVPPLRERVEDLEDIANHLLSRFEQKYQRGQKFLHPNCLDWLEKQAWPGNVRELENWLLRHYLLSETSIIHIDNVEPVCKSKHINVGVNTSFQDAKEHAVEQFAEHYIASVLAKTSGNVTHAAKLAGKERRAFGKLMKKYSIDAKEFCNE